MNNQTNPYVILAWHYTFKLLPVLIGGGAIYLGYDLFIRGVTGSASISIQSKDIGGQLLNAAPGLFFAIGGFWTVIAAIRRGAQIESVTSDDGTRLFANVRYPDEKRPSNAK